MLISFSAFSQETERIDNGYKLNLNILQGAIIEHSPRMVHLASQNPKGIEIDINRQTYGSAPWQILYKYPKIGLAFHYFMMDPTKPLGNSISMTPYFSPVLLRTKKLELTYRIGCGAAYVEKRYHPISNPDNNLLSSRLNFSLYGNFNLNYQFSHYLSLNTGAGLIHYSNGAYKIPNLGINIPSVHVGLGFGSQRPPERDFSVSEITYQRRTYLNFVSSHGLKEIAPYYGQKWYVSSMSVYGSRSVSRKSLLNLGLDFFYNSNYSTQANNPDPESMKYLMTSAIMFGHELVIHKITFGTQIGYYIHDPLKPNTPIYQRIALRYFFATNFNIGVALKTHYGNADFVEWGLGMRF